MFDFAQLMTRDKLTSTDKFEILLLAANTLLALFFSLFLATVVVCYPLADWFSFKVQLASHITLIFSAALVKIAYVCRCIAQYELHKEVR